MVATPKYIIKASISFIVVINGPDADAGSIFNLLSISGTNVPIIADTAIELKIAINTICAISIGLC